MSNRELDELTEKWLRDNDPYYTDKRKNKRQLIEYNYETYRQRKYRRMKEIEFNRLFFNRLLELINKNVDSVKDYLE